MIQFPTTLSTTALATAGIGGIAVFWGYIQGFFSRISSYVIVTTELQGDVSTAVVAYMRKNYKTGILGERRFTGFGTYIRPKDRYGSVAFEITGRSLIFWNKWKPVFVSSASDKDGDFTGIIKLTYLRGLFHMDTVIHDAITLYNKEIHEKRNEDSTRYQVVKHFGRNKFGGGRNDDDDHSHPSNRNHKKPTEFIPLDHRPIGWTREDLGASTSKTPFDNLAYSENVLDFYKEVKHWNTSEKWYRGKGLPWRLGAALLGPPGTGKTSLVRAIGQELDMPVHVFDLCSMSNEELTDFWRKALQAAPVICLFEDLDRLFKEDRTLKGPKDGGTAVSLDCLLNCINGVESSDGILVLITANDISKLDTALGVPDKNDKSTRPGRLDRSVYFGPLEESSRFKIATRILSDCSEQILEVVKEGEGDTGAQFESRCQRIAIQDYWNKYKG